MSDWDRAGMPDFDCDECGLMFATVDALSRHMDDAHECYYCGADLAADPNHSEATCPECTTETEV